MTKALVLMKAMPPTKGHKALIEFASHMASETTVLVDMASNEPFREQRILAIMAMCRNLTNIREVRPQFITMEAQQESDDPNFWDTWTNFLKPFQGYDYVIGSEDYCFKVAEIIGARYIPYDPNRELINICASDIRINLWDRFNDIAVEFQNEIRQTVTVFGAESTGKTTLSKELAKALNGHWVFEWARPYLETVGTEINVQSMTDIWNGQWAVESMAMAKTDKPFIVRDTDLFSTVGYWEQPHWQESLGPVPEDLIQEATLNKADLYIITKSNIPFEEDPLRYGGDRRESPDEYWIALAEKYNLNYVVLDSNLKSGRLVEACQLCWELFDEKTGPLEFDRRGA